MPLGALGVTALLTGLDWGAWEWASDTGHATVGLIAGVLMVPAAVAFAGFLLITLVALARLGARRTTRWARVLPGAPAQRRSAPTSRSGDASSPAPGATPSGRIAA
jgi:TRAP-type C4-dicarboxylate transport system permease small subunit